MKRFKPWLMLLLCIMLGANGFSAINRVPVQVQPNTCLTSSGFSGFSVDSVQLLSTPLHGTLTGTPNSFTYCPDSSFIGNDSALVFLCLANSSVCDTFNVIFTVQFTCNTSVAISATALSYTANVTGGSPPYVYIWNPGGNTTATITNINPGTNYCVTVSDNNGCSATACTANIGCTFSLALNYDSSQCAGQQGLSTVNINGVLPISYQWSTTDTVDHICGIVSAHTYCVSATDANGCSASDCIYVSAFGSCNFQAQQGPDTLLVNFNPSLATGFFAASYVWDFGDGVTGTSPDHIYATCGVYYVSMSVQFTNGDSCYAGQYIDVVCNGTNNFSTCQASFTYNVSSTGTCLFTDNSVYYPVGWQWDFGDNTTSALQNPTHTYNALGTYNVCLTTGDSSGCTSSYCMQITNNPVQDLEAELYHSSTVTPGYPIYVYAGYYNNGNVLMNGTAVYYYPVGSTFAFSSPNPTNIDAVNHLLTYDFTNLQPGTFSYANITLMADSTLPIGAMVYDSLWVNPTLNDVTSWNNFSYVTDSVVASWDPNLKSVSPKGIGENGVVDWNTQQLSYVIHFQNTGNAAAQLVIVRDTLSDNIDLSSVTVTGASHEHVAQINGNELEVTFNHINLPDSSINNTASQGFISVRAKLKPGLSLGTQISNTAYIYFDANAPVITNTVVNTLSGGVAGITAIGNLQFELMPNPAINEVMVRGEFENTSTFELTDLLGKQLLQGRMSPIGTTLNVSELSAGIYLVKVKSGIKNGVQRLVVVR